MQQPDSAVSVAGEQGSVAPAKPAAAVKLMNCKPYAPPGAQADEDSFTRCTLVNERTQALADVKAARDELARFKAEAAAPRPQSVVQPMFVQPADPFVPQRSASTRQPRDMAGVVSFRARGIVYDADAESYRVCVFRDGAPVSVEVNGAFLPTLADATGDGRIDGPLDCAPYASNIYVTDVRPGDVVQFIYVRPASHGATGFKGMAYNGYYLRRRLCEVTGQNGPMDFASAFVGCGS